MDLSVDNEMGYIILAVIVVVLISCCIFIVLIVSIIRTMKRRLRLQQKRRQLHSSLAHIDKITDNADREVMTKDQKENLNVYNIDRNLNWGALVKNTPQSSTDPLEDLAEIIIPFNNEVSGQLPMAEFPDEVTNEIQEAAPFSAVIIDTLCQPDDQDSAVAMFNSNRSSQEEAAINDSLDDLPNQTDTMPQSPNNKIITTQHSRNMRNHSCSASNVFITEDVVITPNGKESEVHDDTLNNILVEDVSGFPQAGCSTLHSTSLHYAVTYLPYANECLPTLAEDCDKVTEYTTASSDEIIKLQGDPAYKDTTANNNETVELQTNPAYVAITDKDTTANNNETVELQRNPAYVPITDKDTTANNNETVELQTNPAYVPITDKDTTANNETVELQANPAYVPITDKDTTANNEIVELQANPAYVAITDEDTTANNDETVELQRNLSHVTITDKDTTANNNETVELQRDPAYTVAINPIRHLFI